MSLPPSTAVLTLTAPDTVSKNVPFNVTYDVASPAPGAATSLTIITPAGGMEPPGSDAVIHKSLTGNSGSTEVTLTIPGRYIFVLMSMPGEPITRQSGRLEKYINCE